MRNILHAARMYDKDAGTFATYPQPAQDAWRAPDEIPPVERGQEVEFIIAVQRKSGKIYSFAASYLNTSPLRYEDGCPKGKDDICDGCEDGCPTTGWYSTTGDDGDGKRYDPLWLGPEDKIIGWRDVPQWDAAYRPSQEEGASE
jgi:hypothetical protein